MPTLQILRADTKMGDQFMPFEGPAGLIGWAARWAEVLGAIGAVLVFLVALYVAIRETWRARKDRLREKHDAARAEETARDQAG
jgi:hypothetical protein